VIKGQPENMALLDEVLKRNVSLIDYETLTTTGERTAPRLIAFGEYAGRAGMIDTLRGLGERLLRAGHNNPFVNIGSSYMYPSLDAAKETVASVGRRFAESKHNGAEYPLTCVFTGDGAVGQGAKEIFELLPHEMVDSSDLPEIARSGNPNTMYGCVVGPKDYTERKEPGQWDQNEYFSYPERYTSNFHETILPYSSVIMNAMYWDSQYPRIISNNQMKTDFESGDSRLMVLGDITCDIQGSIEFLHKSTRIEDPFFLWDPVDQEISETRDADGVLVLGVDILPSELPREATNHFGGLLVPLLNDLEAALVDDNAAWPKVLEEGCIARAGDLMPKFEYLDQIRRSTRVASKAAASEKWRLITFRGQLFDSGMINKTFDLLESLKITFRIKHVYLRPNSGFQQNPSKVLVEIDPSTASIDALPAILEVQIANFPDSQATFVLE
jgi:alpha-aminoadipic semialdehyde synthase